MGMLQWFNTMINTRRMGMATHSMAYRLKGILIRTVPWFQMQRQLTPCQVGGRLGRRVPNADLWRSQKLRRYEKPLTNRVATIASNYATKQRHRMPPYRMKEKSPLQVRDALVSRWVNYRLRLSMK